MNDAAAAAISSLPAREAKLLAIQILLADPESLGDDVLESCLYLLRDKLRAGRGPVRQRRLGGAPRTGNPPKR